MRSEELLDAIGDAKDEYVRDVRTAKVPRIPRWTKWTSAIAACLALVFGISLFLDGFGGNAGGGGDNDLDYMYYVGPVLPMSVQDGASGISAIRNVDFDFSGYIDYQTAYESSTGETIYRDRYDCEAFVTDSYILQNESGEERNVTLLYPFIGDMSQWEKYPSIKVGGEEIETTMHPGPYSGSFEGAWGSNKPGTVNIRELTSFDGYRELLSTDAYMKSAFDSFPELDQKVYVYRLHDFVYSETTEDVNPTLSFSFYIDSEKTTVMSYSMNGSSWNEETGYCSRRKSSIEYRPNVAPERQHPDDGYIILLGEDLTDYTLQGYKDGGCDKGEELNDLGCTVTRYETTLRQIMDYLQDDFLDETVRTQDSVLTGKVSVDNMPVKDLYLGLAAELLYSYGLIGDTPMERYDSGMLEDIFSSVNHNGRIIYLSFNVIIPAGESIMVEATMLKDASIDYIGDDVGKDGYDMATTLGSNLTFTEQTASISGYDEIEIISQNFGFDLPGGITEVVLDPNQAHYWMEIQKVHID